MTTTTSKDRVRPAGKREAPATEKATETAHEAIDTAARKAGKVERDVRDRAEDARDKLGESTAAAQAQIDKSLSEFETYVREKPITAAGMAFAAGALAALLLRR